MFVLKTFLRTENAGASPVVSILGCLFSPQHHIPMIPLNLSFFGVLPGHIFCRECLSRLTQHTCPVCRTSLVAPVYPIRKMHVDLSKCKSELSADGPDSRSTRRLRKLEQRIVSEALEGRELTVQRAADLAKQVDEFLRTQSPNEVITSRISLRVCGMMSFLMSQYSLLRIIETLLKQLSASMAHVYEGTSLSRAVKASYEHRIQQLEQSLKEQTRQLGRDDHSKIKVESQRYPCVALLVMCYPWC